MRTLGIDLATEPGRTAACSVDWGADSAYAEVHDQSATDDALVRWCAAADKVGIDCPFGWPEPFVAAMAAHQAGRPWPVAHEAGSAGRRDFAYRSTDLHVLEVTKAWPLSVSTNLIGLTAMRCAVLLDRLAPVDRAGAGRLAEVYPAAALRRWDLWQAGYKTASGLAKLGGMVDALLQQVPGLRFAPGSEQRCRTNHDAFDALVSALVARLAATGRTVRPAGEEQCQRAVTEGWIHLPTSRQLADVFLGNAHPQVSGHESLTTCVPGAADVRVGPHGPSDGPGQDQGAVLR